MRFVTPPKVPKRNVLLYGPPKTGKTAGATSAPGPIALLNADTPNATWYAHSRSTPALLREIQYEGFATLLEIGSMIANGTFLHPSGKPFETLVVDPVNELYRRVLEEFSNRSVSPTLPTYGATSIQLERFFRMLVEVNSLNVVFVAHELPVKDEISGGMERLPATGTQNPSLGQKLMGMVDIVGFTAVVQREGTQEYDYVAQLVNAHGRRGGDRFDALGPFRSMDLTEWFSLGPQAKPAPAKKEAQADGTGDESGPKQEAAA